MKLHFIQNEATPHNNTLIRELTKSPDVELILWYAREKSNKYSWEHNLTHAIQKAHIYGDRSINWGLVFHLIMHRNEKVFMTGWGNPTTNMLVMAFFLSRRSYNMWFDFPHDDRERSFMRKWLRELFYWLLRHSRANIFCVGKMTVNYFMKRNFSQKRLINLPVLVDTSKSKTDYLQHHCSIRKKFHVGENDLFLVAGSRLTRNKGYDLLIQALAALPIEKRRRVKTLIVGQGEELENLLQQINEASLADNVVIENWMDIEKYRACIANADVFVHPARFDAYGGGTLNAMVVGTPVIGSDTAGSTVDRIINEENGWLYRFDDLDKLKKIVIWCLDNREKLPYFGEKARKTALKWTPSKGKSILLGGLL